MLACSQDIFFHNDTEHTVQSELNNYQNLILETDIKNSALLESTLLTEFQGKDKISRQNHLRRGDQLLMNNVAALDLINENSLLENSTVIAHHNSNIKDKEEQVWPPDVESAFIEALESIPKLGRRKILVNGKPCGRNELISDFIFRKTCKIRTRKQVSSHIQVLKNTRKGDVHFMRLLTDSVDQDEHHCLNTNQNRVSTINSNTNPSKPRLRQQPQHLRKPLKNAGTIPMKKYHSSDAFSSDDSSINSSPSPTDYVFEIMCGDPSQQQALSMLQFKDFYDPFQQSLFPGMMTDSNINTPVANFDANNTSDAFFGVGIIFDQNQQNENLEESLINTLSAVTSSSGGASTTTPTTVSMTKLNGTTKGNSLKKRKILHEDSANSDLSIHLNSSVIESKFALWPNYICLYLEYTLPYNPCRPLSHNLSQMAYCYPSSLPVVSIDSISSEKCPVITSLAQNSNDDMVVLLAKTKLDLNLNISDFAFNNTSFFETQTRRTIECTTTIYSFGNVVLESKEVQQALWVNEGKFMYNFVFVNQFFDAFMKGIRSLQSWDEVDIAINNLCVVQSFEDMETRYTTTNNDNSSNADSGDFGSPVDSSNSPLLVMMYEFERGQGTIDLSAISKSNSIDIITQSLDLFEKRDN